MVPKEAVSGSSAKEKPKPETPPKKEESPKPEEIIKKETPPGKRNWREGRLIGRS